MDIEDEQKKVQGTFPDGKLNENDKGALAISVGIEGDNVVLLIGEPTTWVGMPPEMAVKIAQEIFKRARLIGFKDS